MPIPPASEPRRVLLLGSTGTIGRATAQALVQAGHAVTCPLRPGRIDAAPTGTQAVPTDVTDCAALNRLFAEVPSDVLISCLASRTGVPADAWAIDHQATVSAIEVAKAHGVQHVILLSAICVQKPELAFQHAKLAAEAALIGSGLTYSIVRPTAFFKSLSGQIARVRAGKPFLVFGDGRVTACKPISDSDLAAYLVGCIADPARHNRILPIGGPGPALTPEDQARALFDLLGQPANIRRVPLWLMDGIVGLLALLGRIAPPLGAKAELARIGRYYATQSMLVLSPETGQYDADATPETGTDTLFDYYARALADPTLIERGDHAVF